VAPRPGAELFARPVEPNQRRYEALRSYFVEGASAEQVAQRFDYTRATVETLVRDYRAGRLDLFASSRPGPRSEPKKDSARTLILTLRREGRSLAQITRALTAAGTPLGRTAIWEVVRDEGLGRLPLQTLPPASPLTVAAPKTQRLDNGYQTVTPDTIFRHFIEGPGELQFTPNGVNVALRARAHTPVLLDAAYDKLTVKIPWWDGRELSYSFPAA
jgi:transposase